MLETVNGGLNRATLEFLTRDRFSLPYATVPTGWTTAGCAARHRE